MIIALMALATPASAPETPQTIVVRAERLREPPARSQRLGEDILQNQTGLRLDEVLRVIPGVGLFRRTPSGAANATIQGLSLRPIAPNGAGRALVSLDGVPQNDPFGGWIYWSRYDLLFLEQVDIKRGPLGAGFGPMALTGALDLTDARGRPAGVAFSYGSEGSRQLAARQSLSSAGATVTAMGAYSASNGAIPVAPNQRGAADVAANYEAMSLALVTDIERTDGAWSFRAAGFSENKGAGLTGGQSAASGLDVSAARRLEGAFGQARVLIYAQGRDFSNQTVTVTAGRAATIPALDQAATPSSALGASFAFAPQAGAFPLTISADWRRAQGQTQELFRFIGRDFTRTRIAGGTQDLLGVGLFLARAVRVGQTGLNLDGGLRLDYWANHDGVRLETDRATGSTTFSERAKDRHGNILTGRLSVTQVNGPMSLSLYRTFRPPTLNELHRPFRVGNDVTEANTALLPETLVGLDVDVRMRHVLAGGTLSTALTLYANQLSDPIANVTIATGPGTFARVGFLPAGGALRQRRNVGRIDATGLEARFDWQGSQNGLSWFLAASKTDARIRGGTILPQLTGKRPSQAPGWSGIASVTLPVSQHLNLTLSARGEGTRFEDDLNTRKLAAYGALDTRVTWQVTPSLQVFVSGENVLNAPVSTARSGDDVVSLAQGRMVRLGVRFGGG